MKKIIFVLFITIFITGCTVEYNLNIDENQISENININIEDISALPEDSYEQLTYPQNKVYFKENQYYAVDYTEEDNNLYSSFNYVHEIDKFNGATVLDLCYPNRTIENTQNEIRISTTGSFACAFTEFGADISYAQINITTKLKVTESNADEVNNNTYTWNIDKTNYTNKPINIVIEKNNKTTDSKVNNASTELFIILGSITALLIVIGLYMKFKTTKNNKI